MVIRGVIFDINSTLIDIQTDESRDDIFRSISHFLTYQGISLHRGEVRDCYFRIMENQRRKSAEEYPEFDAVAIFREIIEDNAGDFTRSLSAEKREQMPLLLAELYRGISRNRLQLYPGVKDMLAVLKERYMLAAVTDAQSAYAVAELQAVGLLDYLKPVIISGDYGYRKPDKRLFQKALDALNLKSDEVIYVGNDMFRDIFGAQQLKIKTVFFSQNQGGKQIPGVQADYIIYNFPELLQAILYLEVQYHKSKSR